MESDIKETCQPMKLKGYKKPKSLQFGAFNTIEESPKMMHKARQYKLYQAGMTCCCSCGLNVTHTGLFKFSGEKKRGNRFYTHYCLFGIKENRIVMFTIDHILPASLGGINHMDNYRMMCIECNSKRGNALTDEDFAKIMTNPDKHIGKTYAQKCKFNKLIEQRNEKHQTTDM